MLDSVWKQEYDAKRWKRILDQLVGSYYLRKNSPWFISFENLSPTIKKKKNLVSYDQLIITNNYDYLLSHFN